ncbi:MAG TPA: ATPase domain-containing protein [Polyangia bacterium]|nr:ATPase domain-containing protein [Polyangia bacterium]
MTDHGPHPTATGIAGLDDILRGGLPPNRVYLVQGDPGAGKTTLGLQFLLEGVRVGDVPMYISLSESRDEVNAVARSHGWSLDGIHLFEMQVGQQEYSEAAENTLFEPSEVELREVMQRLLSEIDRVKATRVVFDSLSELRLLAQHPLRYRRQILQLKQFFSGRHSTVLFLDDRTAPEEDRQLQSVVHGVLLLEMLANEYGNERRRLRVVKLRGLAPRGGYHDFAIRRGGLEVFPRLVAAEHPPKLVDSDTLPSGVRELDSLLGGGVDRGTATLILGPAGSGKSSLSLKYALSAARRGEHVEVFAFDERIQTLMHRCRGLGMDLEGAMADGRLTITQVDPAEMGPGEFVATVTRAVTERQTRVVVIDSLNGYLNAMPEERTLALQLHELLSVLNQSNVTTFMVMAQHGLLGPAMQSPLDISYLADTVVLLRYFEADGAVRKAISVVKKRSGSHEDTIREYRMGSPDGIAVGQPLSAFRGVLTGVPTYVGGTEKLLIRDRERPHLDGAP